MVIKVLLPLAIDQSYSYAVPVELQDKIGFGKRVIVQFGRKRKYSALVVDIKAKESVQDLKFILDVYDENAIITEIQYDFWTWMASYYMAFLGEIMNAALPGRLKLSSETLIVGQEVISNYLEYDLNESEYLLAEALSIQNEMSITEVENLLQRKSVFPVIQKLIDKNLVAFREELSSSYRAKKIPCVRFTGNISDSPFISDALNEASKSEYQTNIILALIQLSKQNKAHITKTDLSSQTDVKTHAFNALVKKGIIENYKIEVNRLNIKPDRKIEKLPPLNMDQTEAFAKILDVFEKKNVCLLHGVTGSGKTQIYLEMIQKIITEEGGQILFLLPEIGLTTQIISRIANYIDYPFIVYHSKISENERVDIYKKVSQENCFVIGPRSALLLPFYNLNLVVIDEEHDSSYKQQDPSPRYHARDSAIYLAHLHQAKVLLGSATPSLESYWNAKNKKYGIVSLLKRFGEAGLPTLELAQLTAPKKEEIGSVNITTKLKEAMELAFAEKKQIILFQNRRGYSPQITCPSCGWVSKCIRCDISMTYHKRRNELTCHYCSYHAHLPENCPECGYWFLDQKGIGTEKVEETLSEIFPDKVVQRFDFDTVGTKRKLEETLFSFEQREIDVLVGTQMVTKGLDFDNVGLVGVLSVEGLLAYPDFRTFERAFQTIMQVGGRAGRKDQDGRVILQTYNVGHVLLHYVMNRSYEAFYEHEIAERQKWHYPPDVRLIEITLLHKNEKLVHQTAQELYRKLYSVLTFRISEPAIPHVAFIKNQHQRLILIKSELHMGTVNMIKSHIKKAIIAVKSQKGRSTVRININVDPY